VARRRVRPATRLCHLFPTASRGATWPRLAAALGLPDLPELPHRRVPPARPFRIALGGVTAAWWLLYPLLVLATGDPFSLTYGLVIWCLLALVVAEWFGILWAAFAFDYLERVRVPRVRHLIARLVRQQAGQRGARGPTPRQVWEDVAALVAARARVPAHEICPEQRFGELPDHR
jgi:hypothetical protein